MLQLIDKELERRQCFDCHAEVVDGRHYIYHSFVPGVYHSRLCLGCHDKRTLAAMAKVEAGESIEFGALPKLDRVFVCGEHGVMPIMANFWGTLQFPIVKTRVSKRRTIIHFLAADGRTWRASASHPVPERYKYYYGDTFRASDWGKRSRELNETAYQLRPT